MKRLLLLVPSLWLLACGESTLSGADSQLPDGAGADSGLADGRADAAAADGAGHDLVMETTRVDLGAPDWAQPEFTIGDVGADLSADVGTLDAPTPDMTVVAHRPGHYVLMSDLESIQVPADATGQDRLDLEGIREVAASSDNVKGILMRFYWRQLNPSVDPASGAFVYDFSRVAEHLDLLATLSSPGRTLRYFPMISWRSYKETDHPLPDHLSHLEEPVLADGHRGQIWKPALRAHMRDLLRALAAAHGSHPNFGGLSTQETAIGKGTRDGYTAQLYQQALIDVGKMHREAFPSQQILFLFNFFSATAADCSGIDWNQACGYWPATLRRCGPCMLGHVLATLLPYQIEFGGPDILPDNAALLDNVYPHYAPLAAAGAKLFCHAQKDSYRVDDGAGGYLSMQSIFDYAVKTLGTQSVIWFHKETGTGQNYVDAVPVIEANAPPF